MVHQQEIESILTQVTPWPMEERVALAYEILRNMRKQTRQRAPRHTFDQAVGVARGQSTSPDDATVRAWIEAHRNERFG